MGVARVAAPALPVDREPVGGGLALHAGEEGRCGCRAQLGEEVVLLLVGWFSFRILMLDVHRDSLLQVFFFYDDFCSGLSTNSSSPGTPFL